ncbi:MAG: VOC family protein [Candidatus Hodarchaeota archaeon]
MVSICVIGVYVHNMDEALDFYCNKLGFEVARKYDDCLIHLKNEGPPLILETVDESNSPRYPGSSQVVLCVETKDIEEESNRLRELGVDFVIDSPQPFPAGRFMAMRDPSGNVIELLEFKTD